MGRLLWPFALVAAFVGGLANGRIVRHGQSVALDRTVTRLQEQVATLQARLRTRESAAGAPQSSAAADGGAAYDSPRVGMRPGERFAAVTTIDDFAPVDRSASRRSAAQPQADPAAR